MSDSTNNQLVDEGQFPLPNALGQDINYKEVLDADILKLLGAEKASDEDKQKIYQTAFATVENRVMARIFDQLTDEDIKQWESIDENDKEAMRSFMNEKGVDLPKLYAMEAITYKSELASLTHTLKM
jgi:hypothetical protein